MASRSEPSSDGGCTRHSDRYGRARGTNNSFHSDVLDIEELIGPETITTVPPATLDAFRDHGRVRVTLGTEDQEAEAVLATAAALGLDVHAITEQLQADGIEAFASSFDELRRHSRREAAPDPHDRELTVTTPIAGS